MQRITLVIPTYNEAPWLERCLNSVLHQTVPFDEVIVVDDGSTDETFNILHNYNKFNVIYCDINKGVSHARNEGLKRATGDYVTFLDADDELLPNACEMMHQCINLFHESIIQFNHFRKYKTRKNIVVKYANKDGVFDYTNFNGCKAWWGVWNKVIKREVIECGFDETIRYGEDGVFIMQMMLQGHQIRTIEQCTTVHHFDNLNSLSHTKDKKARMMELDAYRKMVIKELENHTPFTKLQNIMNFLVDLERQYNENKSKGSLCH